MTPENLPPPEEKISSTRPALSHYAALIIAIISLGLALAIGGAAFWCGQRLRSQLLVQNEQLKNTQIQLQDQQNSLQTLNQHWQQLAQWQMQMSRWQLDQAEYFAQLANFHLQTEVNIPAALQLLKMAEESLNPTREELLINLHSLLTQNITALQAIPLPNLPDLIGRLDALNQQILQVPLFGQTSPLTNQTTHPITTAPKEQHSFWQRSLENLLNDLRHLVTIRRTTTPQTLTSTQRSDIQQAMQLKLMQTEWAALNHQPEIYHQNLQQISRWLQQYYPQNAAMQAVLQTLNQLQNVALTPPNLPDLTATLTAIQTARQQLNNTGNNLQPPLPAPPTNAPKSPVPATPQQSSTPIPGPESIAS